MANHFPSRKINLALKLTQMQARPRPASTPRGPTSPKFFLIIGGHHGKSAPARNAFSAKECILEQKENLFIVDFGHSKPKTISKSRIFSMPSEQTPQSISAKEEVSLQMKNSVQNPAGASPKQIAPKTVKLLNDMCNSVKSQSSVQKGLKNKSSGRFDQNWVIKWFVWFSFVVAMQLKPWAVKLISGAESFFSNNVRAESAKTPHGG